MPSRKAASTLGAYSWYTFWKVTWPSIRWGVIYGVVLTVARTLGEFGAVLVVSGNIMNKTQTATTLVYQDVENFNVVEANGVALVLAVFSVGLLLLMEWAKNERKCIKPCILKFATLTKVLAISMPCKMSALRLKGPFDWASWT